MKAYEVLSHMYENPESDVYCNVHVGLNTFMQLINRKVYMKYVEKLDLNYSLNVFIDTDKDIIVQ